MEKKVALVLGGTGMAGTGVVEYLAPKVNEWEVLVVSRQVGSLQIHPNAIPISADLLDPNDLSEKLKGRTVTHIFYAAVYTVPTVNVRFDTQNERDYNKEMIQNVIQACCTGDRSMKLKHITLITGAKYNGFMYPDWANYSVPFKEDGPTSKHPGDDFYFGLEDSVVQQARVYGYTWSVVRPHFIIGVPYTLSTALASLGMSIGIYATLLKELGRPLIFPGTKKAYSSALSDGISVPELGRMCVWTATTPKCANQAFNGISSGIPYTWEQMWPRIAMYFQMDYVPPGETPIDLTALLKGYEAVWGGTKDKYNLNQTRPLTGMLNVGDELSYVNLTPLSLDWNTHMSPEKLQNFGFEFREEKVEMYYHCFEEMEKHNIIPKYSVRRAKL